MTDFDLVQQRLNLARALQERPDTFARKTKIAQALQKPPGLLTTDDEALYDVDNTMRALDGRPVLLKRVRDDRAFATLAHDDFERLANIEHLTALQQARARQEEATREQENAPWWLHELGSSIWTGLRRGINNIDIQQADAAQQSLDTMEATEGKLREIQQRGAPDLLGQNIGADPFELTSAAGTYNPDELYRKKHTALERARDQNLAEYEEDLPDLVPTRAAQTQREMEAYMAQQGLWDSIKYMATHPRMATNMAAESLGQFAPTLLATGVATAAGGPVAGAAVIGAGSAQMEHGSTLAERIDASGAQQHKSRADILADQQLMNDIRHEARTRAAVIGTTEALTFGLTGPAYHAVRARVPGWKGTLAAWGAGTGVQATGGAGGEAAAQLATHGEITSWPAVVAEFALEVLQGAPEIAFHAQTGTRLLRQEHAQDMANLRELGENVQNSTLRQRAPDEFDAVVAEMAETGNMKSGYIDGEVLHQSDLAEALAHALPEQAAEIRDAIDHGGQVQIRGADLVTRILPDETLHDALAPHLRFDADGYTQAELDSTAEAEIRADLARDVADAATEDARQAEVDAIRDEYAAQLEATGRFTPAVNKIYGTLIASFYSTTAEKLGISAQELMTQRPLNIVGEPIADGLNQAMPDVAALISGAKEKIRNFVQGWRNKQGGKPFVDYLEVNEEAVQEASRHGLDIAGYRHVISDEAVNHIINRHGDQKIETTRAQIALTDADLETIADVVSTPDRRVYGMKTKDGLDIIASIKRMPDGTLSLVEEVRTGRRKLAVKTLRKHVAATDFNRITQVLLSNARSDGNHANIHIVDIDRNHTPAPDNGQDTLQQNKGAPRGAFDPATNTIALLEKADLSTFIHELGHFFFENNIALANELIARDNAAGGGTLTDGEKQLINDVDALLAQANLDLDTWNIMTLDQRRYHHETVARQFEAYLMEGKAPVPELQGLFARARAWLFQLYKKLTTLNVQLTDDVRQVFDRMIAGEAAINQARQMRLGVEMLLDADLAGMTADEFKQFQQQFQDATNLALDEMQLRQLADAKAIARLKHKALQNKNKEAQAARGLMEMDARRIIYSQPVYRAWQLLTAKMTPDTTIASRKRAWTDSVEPAHDDLFTAIAKLGGINRQQIESTWGFDPADKISPVKPGFFVLRKTGGESIDGMKRLLEQYGYLSDQDTLNDFYDLFMEQHRGNTQYSNQHIPDTSSGKAGEGANLQNLPAFRLDYRSLEDMGYSADQINSLGKKVQKTGGIHPDLLAELILDDAGNAVYGSGDELVLDLMTVPDPKTAVRDLADQLMQQQYSELATPQAIAEAADLAIHNDLTLRVLATEYNALAKAAGKPTLVSRVARQLAQEVIGRTRVRDLNPAKYTRMEGKAARRAFEAAKKGDVALAAAEKRNQLLQAAHAREALEAKAEIKKMINYLRRADNLNPKKIDIAYREQIEALLDGYSLRQRSNKALERRQTLAEWVQQRRDEGYEPDIPEYLLDDLNRKPWQELTVDELRGLVDTVKQIEHLGTYKNRLLSARKQRDYHKAVDAIVASIDANATRSGVENRTPTTWAARKKAGLKRFLVNHMKIAMMARRFDGDSDGGAMWEHFIRPANRAADKETSLRAEATAKLTQILAPLIDNRAANRKKTYRLGGKNRSFTHNDLFVMALNWGNEGNRQRLLGGEGWTAAEFEPLLGELTAAELDAVQAVWDYYETFRPEIAAKERRVNGVEPEWVAPMPFTVQSADGQTVNLRGGYYPIRYDLQASERAAADDAATQAQAQLRGVHSAATTRRGHTKSRVKEVHDRPLVYSFAGIYSGFSDIIHDLSWHEFLIDTNRLLRSSRIQNAIKDHYGTDYLRQLQGWVQDIAVGDNQTLAAGEEALRTVRRFASMAGLGFNAVSALKQPLGLLQSVARVGGGDILTATAQFIASPVRMTREAKAASTFMQNRTRTRFRELNELRNALEQQSKTRQFIARYSYALIMAVQQQVDVITWHAQLNKSLREGATAEDAVAQADQAVIDSQGSGLNKDLSAVERGGEWRRLFTVYYSYMNAVLNLEINALTSKRSLAYKAGTVLMLSALMPILDAALNSLLKPGDDDKWDKENLPETLGKAVFNGLTGHFFALRELQWSGYGGYSGPTGLRGLKDAYNLIDQAGQGEVDDGLRRALINTAGSWFGLPSAQINRSWDGIEALTADKTDNPLAIAFGYHK